MVGRLVAAHALTSCFFDFLPDFAAGLSLHEQSPLQLPFFFIQASASALRAAALSVFSQVKVQP